MTWDFRVHAVRREEAVEQGRGVSEVAAHRMSSPELEPHLLLRGGVAQGCSPRMPVRFLSEAHVVTITAFHCTHQLPTGHVGGRNAPFSNLAVAHFMCGSLWLRDSESVQVRN